MTQPRIASIAHLIAEPVRAVMLITLADGSSLTASALAEAAGVTPQTASSHLAKMLEGGLLKVMSQGRNRFYQLAGADVSHILETLAAFSPDTRSWKSLPNRSAEELRFARCCYDHLAGQLGVAVTAGMVERGLIAVLNEREYALTQKGVEWMRTLGMSSDELAGDGSGLARRCMDWTEKQHHLAGALGAHLLETFCALGWVRRTTGSRAIAVTVKGWSELQHHFGIDEPRDEGKARLKR